MWVFRIELSKLTGNRNTTDFLQWYNIQLNRTQFFIVFILAFTVANENEVPKNKSNEKFSSFSIEKKVNILIRVLIKSK